MTVAVATISAHHAVGSIYDIEKPVLIKGVVTEVEWKNPHVLLHLDAKGNDGATVSWILEARAAYIMRRMGMEQDFIKPGETVDLIVCVARDGSHKAGVHSVQLDGVMKQIGMCGNAQAAG